MKHFKTLLDSYCFNIISLGNKPKLFYFLRLLNPAFQKNVSIVFEKFGKSLSLGEYILDYHNFTERAEGYSFSF